MSKKTPKQAESTEAAVYDLHTEAVDALVTATKENTPRYSEAELNKYRSGKVKRRFPQGLKVLLIKFWFYGAVCFFVFWGLGLYLQGLDMYFVAALILGMVTDLLINHFLRFTEKLPGGSKKWMMVTRRGTGGFFLNIAYGFLLMFLVITVYQMINTAIFTLYGGSAEAPLLHVEPFAFGLITTGADMLCVGIRNTMRRILADARGKA
ncbi:MAG: hypothetical protein PUC00_11870 [Clostridiales bacterium]|nr:hypothetical protein [Clostridiales bacterium]